MLQVSPEAFQQFQSALQSYLTNSQNARAALAILPSIDQQMVTAFQEFAKALTPVLEPAPAPAPVETPTAS